MNNDVVVYKTNAARLLRAPDDPWALTDQFQLLSDHGDERNDQHHVVLARRAYKMAPNDIKVAFNYATACQRSGSFEEAVNLYQHCLELDAPGWKARCLRHLGIANRSLGENKRAIDWYDKAIELDDNLEIKKDRALAIMASGDLITGLQAFEIRRQIAEQKAAATGLTALQRKLPSRVVHWEGQPIAGKHIVVYHEEGIGDFIMMSRFIPRLREMGA
jgi:tetratricopeptide (TPR) repeat protein